MRRAFRVSMVCVVCAFMTLSGCSGEEGSPAIASNDSEQAMAAGGVETNAGKLAPESETACTAAEPNVAFDQIPQTADKALRAVLDGLHENRPEELWNALPAPYQKDVNDLVHLFAARVHPEAWKWFVKIARKGVVVLRLPRDDGEEATVMDAAGADETGGDAGDAVQRVSAADRLAILKNQHAPLHGPLVRPNGPTADLPDPIADRRRREGVSRVLEEIADTGPAGLERLKTADVGALLRHEGGRTLLDVWRAAAGTEFRDEMVQDFLSLVADPSKVRLVLKESTDDAAIVGITFPNDVPGDIEFVRVDRKWIPRQLADSWTEMMSGLKRDVVESLPSQTATENFGAVFQFLGMIDMSFDAELAYAQTDDESPAEVNSSLLVDAPMLLLRYLIVGPSPSELDEMMTDADGLLVDPLTHSDTRSSEDDPRETASVFEQLVGRSLVNDGKRVAVMCHTGAVVQAEHPMFAAGVIEEISRRFKTARIDVVDSDKVVSWTKSHVDAAADIDLLALGTDLEADFVVHFQIETLGFAEENYPELRQGRALGHVVVVELVADESGQKRPREILRQRFKSKHPNSPAVAADSEDAEAFKQRYLARLHYELSRLFLREP